MLNTSTLTTFEEVARDLGIFERINWSHKWIRCRTWGKETGKAYFHFGSADNPESLRGPNWSGCWIDEAGLLSYDAYRIVLGRLRQAREHGWLTCTFTPKGKYHWTYRVFVEGTTEIPKAEDGWLVHSRTDENPFLHNRYIRQTSQQYTGLWANQELGGMFVDIEGALWPAEYFAGHIWPARWPETFELGVVCLDPSLGKSDRKGDYSAAVFAGLSGGMIWVDSRLVRARSDLAVGQTLELFAHHKPLLIGVETNQFQELLLPEFRRQAQQLGLGPLPLQGVVNTVNKQVRIQRIGYYLAEKTVRFRDTPDNQLLDEQLREFPEGAHDDGPDALEMCLRLLQQLLAAQFLTEGPERIVS